MLADTVGKRDVLLERLSMDEQGRIALDGVRVVILPAHMLAQLRATGERLLGRGWSGVMYYVGIRLGQDVARSVRGNPALTDSPMAVAAAMGASLQMLGWGRVDAAGFDFKAGEGSIRLLDCPSDDLFQRRAQPFCSMFAGCWAGIVNTLWGRDAFVEETRCRSIGDPACEFAVRSVIHLAGT